MRFVKILLLILVALFVIKTSYADIDIDTYNYDFKIIAQKVNVENKIMFEKDSTGIFKFDIPADATSVRLLKDNEEISYSKEINIEDNKELKLTYVTKEFLEGSNFLITIKAEYNIDNLNIKLKLPEGATLTKPIKDESLQGGSAYPIPSKLSSDGQSLILEWGRTNFRENDELSILVIFDEGRSLLLIIVLIAVILALAIFVVIFISKYKPNKTKKIKRLKESKRELKEDEQQIIRILHMREGQCEQGTLRVLTDFSKAKLSRILSELEERKIILKEKRGKKNLVFLKK